MTTFHFEIDTELHARFKTACSYQRVTQQDTIEKLVREYTDEVFGRMKQY